MNLKKTICLITCFALSLCTTACKKTTISDIQTSQPSAVPGQAISH